MAQQPIENNNAIEQEYQYPSNSLQYQAPLKKQSQSQANVNAIFTRLQPQDVLKQVDMTKFSAALNLIGNGLGTGEQKKAFANRLIGSYKRKIAKNSIKSINIGEVVNDYMHQQQYGGEWQKGLLQRLGGNGDGLYLDMARFLLYRDSYAGAWPPSKIKLLPRKLLGDAIQKYKQSNPGIAYADDILKKIFMRIRRMFVQANQTLAFKRSSIIDGQTIQQQTQLSKASAIGNPTLLFNKMYSKMLKTNKNNVQEAIEDSKQLVAVGIKKAITKIQSKIDQGYNNALAISAENVSAYKALKPASEDFNNTNELQQLNFQ